MNNEETHDHEHNQGRSIIARQPYRPPPCEADDPVEAAAEQHAGETHGGDAHAHDEHQHAAETDEHAHDAHGHRRGRRGFVPR